MDKWNAAYRVFSHRDSMIEEHRINISLFNINKLKSSAVD